MGGIGVGLEGLGWKAWGHLFSDHPNKVPPPEGLTQFANENKPFSKGKDHVSNHHFSGGELLNFGGVSG